MPENPVPAAGSGGHSNRATTMSKKDYQVIADLLHRTRQGITRHNPGLFLMQFDLSFLPMVADELAETNPRFDRQRFINAVINGADSD